MLRTAPRVAAVEQAPIPDCAIVVMDAMRRHTGDRGRVGVRILIALGATLGGWAAISLGFGVGLPRARGSVLGLAFTVVALGAGAAAIAIAGGLLFRVTRGWTRLVLVPWALVVLVAVYSLSIALAAVHPPHPTSSTAIPPGAVRIDMTAADGVQLSGWYLASRNGAAVVLRHGSGSTAAETAEHARALHDAGYGVLATDARGHGDSGGEGMALGWFGELDIQAAIDALAQRADVDSHRIGVVGLSMGGEEAIGAAAADERVRVVVAEGATGRTAADKTWLADEYGAAGVVQGTLDTVTYGVVDLLTPAVPPPTLEEAAGDSAPTPILLIAAGDVPDERSVAERLSDVDPARVLVWVVPAAGHVQALRTVPVEWRTRVVGFLDAALRDG